MGEMRRRWDNWAAIGSDMGAGLVLLVVSLVLQYGNGAFTNEFGNHPDEAAHYVTGLMIHDYLWSGDWSHPSAFAEAYYVHFPKVALGHWPPFFYVLQALWMSVFPIGRVSMILFMAVLTAWLATAVYGEARLLYGRWAGLGLGVLLLLLPPVQHASAILMADILMALLCFQAVRAFGRFLDHNRWQDACAFGLWSTLAILTKGTGMALALLPPAAVLFSRRFALMRSWTFWLPAVLVAGGCAPWYFLTYGMVQSGWHEGGYSWGYSLKAIHYYSRESAVALGAGMLALAVIGLCARVLLPALRGGATGRWSAFGGWLVGFFILQCLIPCGVEERFVVPVLPVLVIAVAAGAERVAAFVSGVNASTWRRLICPGLIGVLFLAFVNPWPSAIAYFGYSEVATEVLRNSQERGLIVLVSSDSFGEGAFVSEISQRDRQRAHIVLRGSKVLGKSDWVGKDFALRFANEQEVARYLEQLAVDFIVFDATVPPELKCADERQLLACLESASSPYRLAGTFPFVRRNKMFSDGIRVYRLQFAAASSPRTIRIPMDFMLGKTLEVTLP